MVSRDIPQSSNAQTPIVHLPSTPRSTVDFDRRDSLPFIYIPRPIQESVFPLLLANYCVNPLTFCSFRSRNRSPASPHPTTKTTNLDVPATTILYDTDRRSASTTTMDVIQLTLLLVVIVGIAIYTAIVAVVTRLFHTPIVDTPPALPTNSPIEVNLRLVLLPGTTEGDIAQMIRGITIKKMPICASPQGLNDANIVKSLVPSITDDDWVATTRFFPTDAFVEYSRGGNQLSGQLVFKDHRVTYDDHFHNLTPLYSPDATRDGDAMYVRPQTLSPLPHQHFGFSQPLRALHSAGAGGVSSNPTSLPC